MHQSTTPSSSQTIWLRWASRQFHTVLIVQTMLPVTFGYSLSSEAVVMRQMRRWKRLWQRSLSRSHKRTSMEPSKNCWNDTTSALQPEEITRLESHVCTINKSSHTKKAWKLIQWTSCVILSLSVINVFVKYICTYSNVLNTYYIYPHKYSLIFLDIHGYTSMQTYTDTHRHTHTRAYTHTHIHIYIYTWGSFIKEGKYAEELAVGNIIYNRIF